MHATFSQHHTTRIGTALSTAPATRHKSDGDAKPKSTRSVKKRQSKKSLENAESHQRDSRETSSMRASEQPRTTQDLTDPSSATSTSPNLPSSATNPSQDLEAAIDDETLARAAVARSTIPNPLLGHGAVLSKDQSSDTESTLAATGFQKRTSLSTPATSHTGIRPFAPNMALDATPTSVPHETSPFQTTATQDTQSAMATTKPTKTSMAPMTTRDIASSLATSEDGTASTQDVEMQDSSDASECSNTRTSTAATEHDHLGQLSPALTEMSSASFNTTNSELSLHQLGSTSTNTNESVPPRITFTKPNVDHLRMRRATSPKKLGSDRLSPLRINTNLPIPPDAPPSKRTKTENKIEIEYDSASTPRIKQTPTTPATLSPFITSARPTSAHTPTPSSGVQLPSALPSAAFQSRQALVASRWLHGTQQQSPAVQAPAIAQKKPFGLIDALIADSSLCISLVGYLDVPSLISLYAISKKFHYYFNKNATGFILSSMRTWAPGADEVYPWRCYESLCIKDPIKRQKAKALVLGADVERLNLFSRDVPSLRWLQMVVWREGVVKDIMTQLVTKGLRTPRGSRDAIKRLWFMLDLPLNAHRLALMRCRDYFSDKVLELLTHLFLKVDMFFTDPAFALYRFNHPNQRVWPNRWANGAALGCNLREKLLAERSLTSLWRVMRGWSPEPAAGFRPILAMDILNLWVRHRFRFRQNAPQGMNRAQKIMKMPMRDFMDTGYERIWRPETYDDDVPTPVTATAPRVNRPRPLLRPDELIMAESINRQLSLHREWTAMMLWGFVDPNGRDVRVPSEQEIISKTREHWSRKEKIQMALAAQAAAKDGKDVGDMTRIFGKPPKRPRPTRSKAMRDL
ncbi:hypothetical protein HII31_11674 [Pseudocercospora fuligena]|uniref:Uncharacterized protein n=1 Tax=Pseudocercospora fuligena TaxID=685502 RepID=A0A8H6R842_9PEZI|nr:hypothetical protein HII31_11674 [Pseudocercospora fuligena]